MEYRREIDGLRALAVLPVILYHAGFRPFSGGFVGVDVFFVVSGYLITSILLVEKESGKFSLANFYFRRARRILPALFVVIFACIPLAWCFLLPSHFRDFSKSLVAVSLFSSNMLFWKESGYFDTSAELKPLLHTWSLAVEEQYYLLFPLFLTFAWSLGKRVIMIVLAIVAFASLFAAQYGSMQGPLQSAAFYLLPARGWEILLGVFAAFVLAKNNFSALEKPILSQAMSIGGVLLVTGSVFLLDKETPFPGIYALFPTVGTLLIILFATPSGIAGRFLGCRVLVGIGLISYSAYLWHQPVFVFARHAGGAEMSFTVLLTLSAASLALAFLSWKYVEVPFRNRKVIGNGLIVKFGVLGTLALACAGVIGTSCNGFASRYTEEQQYLATFDYDRAKKYVYTRFYEHRLKPFGPERKEKIFIVGDSYAEDLVNALAETGIAEKIQLSTMHISKHCGNLYLHEDFTSHIERKYLSECRNDGWYEKPEAQKIIRESDAVWLASSWQPWQAELVSKTVENLKEDFGKEVLVFGRKEFGKVHIPSLIKLSPEERGGYRSRMSEWHLDINRKMKESVPSGSFVDVSGLLCGSDRSCPLFTADGKLITFDGTHLTSDGAREYGKKLLGVPHVAVYFSPQRLGEVADRSGPSKGGN